MVESNISKEIVNNLHQGSATMLSAKVSFHRFAPYLAHRPCKVWLCYCIQSETLLLQRNDSPSTVSVLTSSLGPTYIKQRDLEVLFIFNLNLRRCI